MPTQRHLLSIDSGKASVQNSRQSLNVSSVPHRDDHASVAFAQSDEPRCLRLTVAQESEYRF